MRIVAVGLRGFPNIQGGIETHCEELYPRIAQMGHEIIVVRRSGFIKEKPILQTYKGVFFKDISSPMVSGLEAAVHTLKGIIYARKIKADIVHIHAIGPAIAIPLAKLLKLKIVVTHHGPDYDREKWGFFARFILKTGERFTAMWANEIISISTIITDILSKKYHRVKHVHLIYNGITSLPQTTSKSYLEELGIQEGKYILAVGRFVEEKRFDKLIKAYIKLNYPDYQLVIAGNADHPSSYCNYLKNLALENQVILPGIVKDEKLKQLYSNAALFVLPSSHEGLPITLLEAMSCQRKVLASDIPANKAIGLPEENYFHTNDLEDLISHMQMLLTNGRDTQQYDLSKYDWNLIAQQTEKVYLETIKQK